MITLAIVGGYVLLLVAIGVCLLTFQGFKRLSRCCMSARAVVADVARGDEPTAFQDIVRRLIDDDHAEAKAIEEAGRVQ